MLSAILAVLSIWRFRRIWRGDARRLRLGLYALLVVYFLVAAVIEVTLYLAPVVTVLVVLALSPLPLSVFVFAAMLIRNGIRMLGKEGRSLANSLALLVGIALAVAPIVGGLLIWQGGPVSWGIAAVMLWGSAQLGVQFLVFYAFWRLYERHPRRQDPDAIVVLGSGLIRGKVPPLLRNRIDRGRELAEQIVDGAVPVLVTSGGQGPDEPRSEGEAMREYLLESGYEAGEVVAETASRTTEQNVVLSRRLIDDRPEAGGRQLLVVTNGYHVPRAALISRAVGVDADVVGAPTARYFVPSAFIREFVAVLRMHLRLNVALAILGVLGSVAFVMMSWGY